MWIYIVLAIVGLIVLLLLCPVVIRVSYEQDELKADARYLFFHSPLLGEKRNRKKGRILYSGFSSFFGAGRWYSFPASDF